MELPKEIEKIIKKLEEEGFQGYAVGGCVRDIVREMKPKDFDLTTNASPEQIQKIFKKSYTNNDFGTVTLLIDSEEIRTVEITPYRTEKGYKDKRHPDEVRWAESIEEDLQRRDFTMNAMALHYSGELIDPHKGREDIKKKLVRAVGNAEERISEDALRMMRAVRFSSVLGFSLEEKTKKAIEKNAHYLQNISEERIRDEFVKIVMSDKAMEGVEMLRETGLLGQFLPEILEGYKVDQAKHHIYDCYEHSVKSLEYAAKKKFSMQVRMAALLHDVGKPRVKMGEGEDATFHNHEVVGAKMTEKILRRLKFKKEDVKKITKLVRYHLFYYNVGEVSESSVRRLLRKVGKEDIEALLQVRMADRIGSGVPKAEPYRLRHLRYLLEKVSLHPIDVSMLAVKGDKVMEMTGASPGPFVGDILSVLLAEVISDPQKNTEEYLTEKVRELEKLSREELREKAKEAKKEIESFETKRDEMTKKKYWVS